MKNNLSIFLFVSVVSVLTCTLYAWHLPSSVTLLSQTNSFNNQQTMETVDKEETTEDSILEIKNNQLQIKFSEEATWQEVPISLDDIQSGEYEGTDFMDLIPESYQLTEVSFDLVYVDSKTNDLKIISTQDKGETWDEQLVFSNFGGIRYRKLAYLDDEFGYLVVSGGRVMSQEGSAVYLTHDRGKTWQPTADIPLNNLVQTGGFINDTLGFISYSPINNEEKKLVNMKTSTDGGESWNQATFDMPDQYKEVFVIAEMPTLENGELSVLLNQDQSGDYKGGEVKGQFISKDQGMTWQFEKEVSNK